MAERQAVGEGRTMIGRFDNRYARLPARFFARLDPTPVAAPRLIAFNAPLATQLGLSTADLGPDDLASIFSGNRIPDGAEPLAAAYAGHQFGSFSPQLGDGRAILIGEVRDQAGMLRDIQLKGSGPTPFSRRGDGRAALGPVLREYIISEAMHALCVPATRALAAVLSGEPVLREAGYLPGAVLTRVASSHVRVGSFEYFAAQGDEESVRLLADFVIDRHDPAARAAENPSLALLEGVITRQADLIARWMGLGFIHGVMNTDNMALSGESIDFGPCAFMDAYDPGKVFSSIDYTGRYAYDRQPAIAQWNLARFAEALLPQIDADGEVAVQRATDALSGFATRYRAAWLTVMREKLGFTTPFEGDRDLIEMLLGLMHAGRVDFTRAFRALCLAAEGDAAGFVSLFPEPGPIGVWLEAWRTRRNAGGGADEAVAAMRRANPAIIPRNHRIEQAIEAAVAGDFAPFHALHAALADPFSDEAATGPYALPPEAHEEVTRTFCGT